MPPPPIDDALEIFKVGMMLLSIIACVNLCFMHRRGGVLRYEPRQPVPWGAAGGVLAAVLLLSVAVATISGGGAVDEGLSPKPPSPSSIAISILLQLFVAGAAVFIIAIFTKATPRDLGLPQKHLELLRDVLIGAAACLVALAPVHIVQVIMMHLLLPDQLESGHPFIKMVLAAPDPMIVLLTGVLAVVVAPVCEEITFRLLLQGWLERWEDERIGWRRQNVETLSTNPDTQRADNEQLHVEPLPADVASLSPEPEPEPPRRGVGGFSYGWFPILVSSAAFGLAHYGYGPEPVPIFLLGLVLGYVYQRTHRIIPSIVTHALFNLFTMIILWRMIYHHG
jgi:membrane protease YdiL (CAAX protease family)